MDTSNGNIAQLAALAAETASKKGVSEKEVLENPHNHGIVETPDDDKKIEIMRNWGFKKRNRYLQLVSNFNLTRVEAYTVVEDFKGDIGKWMESKENE